MERWVHGVSKYSKRRTFEHFYVKWKLLRKEGTPLAACYATLRCNGFSQFYKIESQLNFFHIIS